jgi:glucose-6-phosphate isomerase
MDITATRIWKHLHQHRIEISSNALAELFDADPDRFETFSMEACGLFLDYSRNLINSETLDLLFELAQQAGLPEARRDLFDGKPVNNTESRAAMHFALRQPAGESFCVEGEDINSLVHRTQDAMTRCADKIRNKQWSGYSGEPVKQVVTLGIGGSYLGPKAVWEALKIYQSSEVAMKFVANIDPAHLGNILSSSTADDTLFIIVSKSFKTPETLGNAGIARQWLLDSGVPHQSLASHLIAITANTDAAKQFGVEERNIFPVWDWVGGRYSLWSAVGLPLLIGLGRENFNSLLAGAHAMDQHFESSDAALNMPMLLALVGIWCNNFLGADSHAILPYSHALRVIPAHLQQLDMESNGKSVTRDGTPVKTNTAPIIWGGEGTNGQHAFHQLLHQGSRLFSLDFILPLQSDNGYEEQHRQLVANCLGQSKVLMSGHAEADIITELISAGMDEKEARDLAPHKVIQGGRPSNTIAMERITPKTVGALLALYEHKVFCQGIIWHINSFDQWGVESGKVLSEEIQQQLQNPDQNDPGNDSSTRGMMARYFKYNNLT